MSSSRPLKTRISLKTKAAADAAAAAATPAPFDGGEKAQKTLPLLDEVNELIEKERTLLSLKLLEQKQVADDWKKKYTNLVGKMTSVDFDPEEAVEDTKQPTTDAPPQTQIPTATTDHTYSSVKEMVTELLTKMRLHSWVADMSNTEMTEEWIFAQLCKHVFGIKSSFTGLRIGIFRHCELTSSCSAPLTYILRNPNIDAVDFSDNHIGETCMLDMNGVLRDRRGSPQYILLNGNMPLARWSPKHSVSLLLDALSVHTWGLGITLQDFTDLMPPEGRGPPSSPKKQAIAAKGKNRDYKEM